MLYYIFILVRAAIPRYRYDQLMRLGWKLILPLSLAFFFLIMVTGLLATSGLDLGPLWDFLDRLIRTSLFPLGYSLGDFFDFIKSGPIKKI